MKLRFSYNIDEDPIYEAYDDDEMEYWPAREVRGMSEEIGAAMEIA